jgi:hypothetical protein
LVVPAAREELQTWVVLAVVVVATLEMVLQH